MDRLLNSLEKWGYSAIPIVVVLFAAFLIFVGLYVNDVNGVKSAR